MQQRTAQCGTCWRPRCRWRLGTAVHRRHRTVQVRCQQEPKCLGQTISLYNPNVSVWQIPDSPSFPQEMRNAKVLMLDQTGNLHSIYREHQALTGAYWDCLGLLPALLPQGPLVILGLGAGTIAHLMRAYYPDRVMHGWELDPAVVEVARQHMGVSKLEDEGRLVIHVGDALADTATVQPDGAVGILVDLFAGGQLLPALTQVSTWQSIRRRSSHGGRVMVNLGEAQLPGKHASAGQPGVKISQAALTAMAEAFEGQVSYCSLLVGNTANMLAISGPPITQEDWMKVPHDLAQYTSGWRTYTPV